jgi:hypothetical protein
VFSAYTVIPLTLMKRKNRIDRMAIISPAFISAPRQYVQRIIAKNA